MIIGAYPNTRLRRNRRNEFIRDLVEENNVRVKDLIYPIFIVTGNSRCEPINPLPDQSRVSIDQLLNLASECVDLGIPGIALFPMIESVKDDPLVAEAYNPNGLVPQAIRALKTHFPELGVFTDIALDAYTYDGHDGISDENCDVLNDITIDVLIKQSLCHAKAGADFVCPSDMMDGRIIEIRQALDRNGFTNTGIMAYSAKYASSFYGPFREATGARSQLGKQRKKTYQMNPANSNEAIHETGFDIAEGADIVMIKPGLPYLDVLHQIKVRYKKPTAAYHVSGEYAMLKAAAQNEWINYDQAIMESLLCFKRAGADMIWTYAALEAARLLKNR